MDRYIQKFTDVLIPGMPLCSIQRRTGKSPQVCVRQHARGLIVCAIQMGMMKNLATTLAPFNISVNDVAPVGIILRFQKLVRTLTFSRPWSVILDCCQMEISSQASSIGTLSDGRKADSYDTPCHAARQHAILLWPKRC